MHAAETSTRKVIVANCPIVRPRRDLVSSVRIGWIKAPLRHQRTRFPAPPEAAHRNANVQDGRSPASPSACLGGLEAPVKEPGLLRWRGLPRSTTACIAA